MDNKNTNSPLSYADAGVNIDAGHALIEHIKPLAKKTRRQGSLDSLGGFGALFELPSHLQQPILVSGTDGVGTKLKIAMAMGKHDTIGIDLVAMCANDILVCGAEPLYFLDYYATGELNLEAATHVIAGIAQGCEQANIALIGGETAEMPGMYHGEDYDLAGFCVGVVEKAKLLKREAVKKGDVLLGLASSGPHANGYSLIRKIIEQNQLSLQHTFGGASLGEALLTPTRIYVKSILQLLKKVDVHALAHITGGGLLDNIPRVIPDTLSAVIETNAWQPPPIFTFLQQQGHLNSQEMYRTFNNGIGMVICIPEKEVDAALQLLTACGETVYQIGYITSRQHNAVVLQDG